MMTPKLKEKHVGVIIELKAVDNEAELASVAKLALNQIKEQRYEAKLRGLGVEQVLSIGLSFCGKEVELEYTY